MFFITRTSEKHCVIDTETAKDNTQHCTMFLSWTEVISVFVLLPLCIAHHWKNESSYLNQQEFRRNGPSRDPRIFQFTTQDSKIRVELNFAIPFLSIPITGKKGDTSALVDVNLGALAAGGIFTVASLIFIPSLFKGFSPQLSYSRSESETSGIFPLLKSLMQESNPNYGICMQKAVCWYVQKALQKIQTGNAGSFDKIVDGLLSNKWLEDFVNGTIIQEAANNGRQGKECHALYSSCSFSKEIIYNSAKNIVSGMFV